MTLTAEPIYDVLEDEAAFREAIEAASLKLLPRRELDDVAEYYGTTRAVEPQVLEFLTQHLLRLRVTRLLHHSDPITLVHQLVFSATVISLCLFHPSAIRFSAEKVLHAHFTLNSVDLNHFPISPSPTGLRSS